jgi:hypothetical protein
LRKE